MKLLVALCLVAVASARFTPITQYGTAADRIEGEYVVKFFDDAQMQFQKFKMTRGDFIFSNISVQEFGDYMGFAGPMTQDELDIVQTMDGIEYIEQNMIFRAIGEQTNVQAWGIDRSDQVSLPLNSIYRWTDSAAGQGAEVFVLDTGILTTHQDFGGRARFIADCTQNCQTGTNTQDQNGHGTHCAGTVASNTYGIAKQATVSNVRVLGANGSGSTAGIVDAIALVNNLPGTRKIISMSLGGGFSTAMNNAVNASHRAGVVNVVASGNSNSDACNASPASAELAVSVNASDRNDVRASFSSFGSCTNIFAPGVGILSTASNGGTATFSGTSMACPHVAGAAALIHSSGNFSADQVVQQLYANGIAGRIVNPGNGSPNLMLFTNPQ